MYLFTFMFTKKREIEKNRESRLFNTSWCLQIMLIARTSHLIMRTIEQPKYDLLKPIKIKNLIKTNNRHNCNDE